MIITLTVCATSSRQQSGPSRSHHGGLEACLFWLVNTETLLQPAKQLKQAFNHSGGVILKRKGGLCVFPPCFKDSNLRRALTGLDQQPASQPGSPRFSHRGCPDLVVSGGPQGGGEHRWGGLKHEQPKWDREHQSMEGLSNRGNNVAGWFSAWFGFLATQGQLG